MSSVVAAPEFVPGAGGGVWRPPIVSIVPTGRPLSEGIRLHHTAQRVGFFLEPGLEGFGMAPVDQTVMPLAYGGAVRTHARSAEGDMFLPVSCVSESPHETDLMVAELARVLTASDGFFDVVYFDPDSGEARRRTVSYKDGLESPTWVHERRRQVGITGTFLEPHWRGEERVVARRVAAPIKPFITAKQGAYSFPFFPILLSDSTVQGEYELTVEGDAPVWPTWRIEGPGKDVTLVGPGGERFFIGGEVASPITVVMDPSGPAVYDDSGLIWGRVPVGEAEMFSLKPGKNTVRMTMVGGSPESEMRLSYREQWRLPVGGGR